MQKVVLHIGVYSFTAVLDDNPAAREFLELLPLDIEMEELNGNEKYHLLDERLPTDAFAFGAINSGDIMLFQDNILVIFYKTHRSDYRYTRIGVIEDTVDLEQAVGKGSVKVAIERLD